MSERIIYTPSDIQALREALGLTQQAFGIRCGIGRSMVGQLESGLKNASPRLALLLGHIANEAEVEVLGVMVEDAVEFLR